MIEIDQLEFSYGDADGDFTLRVPTLSIPEGAAVAITGASGTGKTTLLHLVAGIAVAARGRVRVAGTDLGGLGGPARRDFRVTRIGLVFQAFELLDYLSVLDNVLLPYFINASLVLDASVRERARTRQDHH